MRRVCEKVPELISKKIERNIKLNRIEIMCGSLNWIELPQVNARLSPLNAVDALGPYENR